MIGVEGMAQAKTVCESSSAEELVVGVGREDEGDDAPGN